MFTKFLAAAAALLIATGVAVMAFASPASAHHTDLTATAACSTTGGWDVTWTVINSENYDATVTVSNNAAVPVGTVFPANPVYYSDNANSKRNTYTQHVTTTDAVSLSITSVWKRSNNPTNSKSLTFSSFSAGCGTTESTPVAPKVTTVTECGTVGTVTAGPTTGVVYATTFDSKTGDYTVVATPASGYSFSGAQSVTYNDNVGAYFDCVSEPKPVAVIGECVYQADGTAAERAVTITFDNTASNKAVLFSIAALPQFDTTVPAKQSVTVTLPKASAAGGTYTISADGKSFVVTVAPCPPYTKPTPKIREVSTPTHECASQNVTVSTTTFTIDYLFDATKREWIEQPEVAGTPDVTQRPFTSAELTSECGVTVDTDPTASACSTGASTATALTRWIRIAVDARVVYTATNTVTNVVTPLIAEHTQVDAGKYIVTAVAATGYTLTPTASRTWTFFVEDTTKCEPPVLPIVTPAYSTTPISCTSAGTYTLGEITPGTISWMVDGVPTAAGTYKVAAAGSVTLVATPSKSTDGLDSAWVNPKVLTFTVASGDCELTTLAYTGASAGGPLALAGGMLFLGVGGVSIARRRRVAAAK